LLLTESAPPSCSPEVNDQLYTILPRFPGHPENSALPSSSKSSVDTIELGPLTFTIGDGIERLLKYQCATALFDPRKSVTVRVMS
jgi:hypothetical protein